MSQHKKLLKKLKNAKEAEFDEIHLLLTQLGFTWRSNGSHYTYVKAPHVIGIVRRSGKPVKKVYLENLKDLLESMGL
jgi:predicted RNA binding protein YcfA (HicA-like mRNA interferase family)